MQQFKEGDTVWCAAYGQGEIAEIDPKLERPVIVYFYDGRNAIEAHYTLDGKLGINGRRVLYKDHLAPAQQDNYNHDLQAETIEEAARDVAERAP